MTAVTFGWTGSLIGMAALTVGMSGVLEGGYFGIGNTGGLVMTGFTLLDLLAVYIGNLFAGSVFGVMAVATGGFFLMLGMIEGCWFRLGGGVNGGLQGDFRGAFVGGHGVTGKSQPQCQGKCCGVHYGFFHFFPLVIKI